MNLGEMQILLQRYGFDTGDPLTAWLNAAMHDMEMDTDWPWLESKVETLNTVAKSPTLALPAGSLKVVTLRDITHQFKLDYYNRHKFVRDIEDPTSEGQPEIYTVDALGSLQLWPVPNGAYEMELVTQLASTELAVVGDKPTTGTTEWPLMAHYPIVMKAAAIALQAENEEERAKNALEQYEKTLSKLREKWAVRQLDEPQVVEDVMGYGSQGIIGRFLG